MLQAELSGFEVLIMMTTESVVCWVVLPHSLKTANISNEHVSSSWEELSTCFWCFLLGLLFHPEDGGDIFFQNAWL
jgi:hypothetical protein